jgi:hypothetical protein
LSRWRIAWSNSGELFFALREAGRDLYSRVLRGVPMRNLALMDPHGRAWAFRLMLAANLFDGWEVVGPFGVWRQEVRGGERFWDRSHSGGGAVLECRFLAPSGAPLDLIPST